MTQSLWYLRHEGKVYGPFPAPQINESLKSGKVTPDWEISLNENDWLTIADSAQFDLGTPDRRDERERARQRWQNQDAADLPPLVHDPGQDERARLSVSQDHIRTEALLQADKGKRPSPWAPALALAILAALGIAVWWGQSDEPIETGIRFNLLADCAAPLADGVNWNACNKRGYAQRQAIARNARMERVQLDDAQLPGADLSYALLRQASLRNADLKGVNLAGADLSAADLAGADLSGADLRYAVLKEANLTGTRLAAAKLDKAVWSDGRGCAEGSLGQCQ
jgi:hypothetical protein